jgi:histidinol-phosphatase (PHP family)
VVTARNPAESALGNYHTHSRYDDGHGELEEYVVAAIDKGFRYLGFSGHAPMPVAADWLMTEPSLSRYLEDYRPLPARYAGRITLLLGLEVDYLPGVSSPRSARIASLGLDYVLGSVHFVRTPTGGQAWTVDGDAAELDRGLAADFAGQMEGAVVEYYRRVAEMVRVSPPDIVGHFDLVKKNNRGESRFAESSPWYQAAVRGALDAVAASGCVVEVNTGGIIRGTMDTVYPSPWILTECRERGIRVVVNADAHRPEHMDGHFGKAFGLLREAGFRSRVLLTDRGWEEVEL